MESSRALPHVYRPRRQSYSSRSGAVSRRRTLAWLVATLVASVTVAWLIVSSLRLAGRRQYARSRRSLVGFTSSRLADVPSDLQSAHLPPAHDLLTHPLLNASRPECSMSKIHSERYEPLSPAYGTGRHRQKSRSRPHTAHDKPRHSLTYFIALNLYSSSTVLPSLIHALHSLVTSLGPERFTISIYENGSKDVTPAQLFLFAKLLDRIGVGHVIVSSPKPKAMVPGKRITMLADLRNLALQPMFDAPPGTWDRVMFINDVHLCETEIKELMLQHEVQAADMSCGMDYKELAIPELANWTMTDRTLFYDLWVSRDMAGLPFYKIKYPTGDWELPSLALPHSNSRDLFQNLLPFQVYSCFNGITILDATLFHAPHSLRFRAEEQTDIQSECFLICRDMWNMLSKSLGRWGKKGGRGAKIQVVPRVSVAYEVAEFDTVRKDSNTSALIENGEPGAMEAREMIRWQRWAPKLVASYPHARWNEEVCHTGVSHEALMPPD
ncbi:alpha-1,3-mannosyltransferase, partial [Phenoliferia sp. Uapishka_3]